MMTYDLVSREMLHDILVEYGIAIKLVRLTEMCLNETYGKICIGKNRTHFRFRTV
jgi:hypothetical protein